MKAQNKSSGKSAANKAGSAKRMPVLSKARSASAVQIKPGSVLARMGGLPKHMLQGDGSGSSRTRRKQVVKEFVAAKAERRK
jgi:hypothetical protein